MRKLLPTLAFLILIALGLSRLPQRPEPGISAEAFQGMPRIVTPQGTYASLPEALADAAEGDLIEVYGGVHLGPLVIDKTLRLQGHGLPVIDGQGKGTVVQLLAPGTQISGFRIINSGKSLDDENAGIGGEAPGLVIENNILENVLFGIYLLESPGSLIRANQVHGMELDLARRGDPIRIWYSNKVQIVDNQVAAGRDVVLWYSNQLVIERNLIRAGRYGLHFMYCDDAWIRGNQLSGNSVGAFLMYSRRLQLIGNTIAHNRGPSGYGIGMKDLDDAVVRGNLFYGNRVGVYLDNSPREVDSRGWIVDNLIAYNDIGVELLPSVRHNFFSANSFIGNQEQVSIAGGGAVVDNNQWSENGLGNYWSDYAGYDQDADGRGDLVYKSDRLFEDLSDRYPQLLLFRYSPAAQAIDFAARAFPLVKPQPKLVDLFPLMAPRLPQGLPALPAAVQESPSLSSLLVGLLGLLLLGGLWVYHRRREQDAPADRQEKIMIDVQGVSKRFGDFQALEAISFQVAGGEAVALWGPNGAGKTTIIRCILGLLPFEGRIRVAGLDVRSDGKAARQEIGFVPQALGVHDDLTVEETMVFYAALRKLRQAPIDDLLAQLDLSNARKKQVGKLSGGMKQRLGVAIALLSDPQILILDEPTSNLDLAGRDEILAHLARLKAMGKSLIFSSHRAEEVLALADRVLVIRGGKLSQQVLPAEAASALLPKLRLRLYLPEGMKGPGLAALQESGLHAWPNGSGIWVQVAPNEKGLPLNVLAAAGIPVRDFQIEQLEGGLDA